MKDGKKITASREESTSYMNQTLPMRESIDLIQRDLMIGERMASFYFIKFCCNYDRMISIRNYPIIHHLIICRWIMSYINKKKDLF